MKKKFRISFILGLIVAFCLMFTRQSEASIVDYSENEDGTYTVVVTFEEVNLSGEEDWTNWTISGNTATATMDQGSYACLTKTDGTTTEEALVAVPLEIEVDENVTFDEEVSDLAVTDTTCATVEENTITGVAVGETTITGTVNGNSYTWNLTVVDSSSSGGDSGSGSGSDSDSGSGSGSGSGSDSNSGSNSDSEDGESSDNDSDSSSGSTGNSSGNNSTSNNSTNSANAANSTGKNDSTANTTIAKAGETSSYVTLIVIAATTILATVFYVKSKSKF